MSTIIEDSRQQAGKHRKKHSYWAQNGVLTVRCALPYGDYIAAPKIAVDTKQDVLEIAGNMCGSAKEKARFREECKKARDAGAELVFLIEDRRFGSVSDLYGQKLKLHNGMTVPGDQLAAAMEIMKARYGCRFVFCKPEDSGRFVMEILYGNDGNNED